MNVGLPNSYRQGSEWGVILDNGWTAESHRPESKPPACHVLAVEEGTCHGASLILSFLGYQKKKQPRDHIH